MPPYTKALRSNRSIPMSFPVALYEASKPGQVPHCVIYGLIIVLHQHYCLLYSHSNIVALQLHPRAAASSIFARLIAVDNKLIYRL